MGEFQVGETVTGYSEYTRTNSVGTATVVAPPTEARFASSDTDTYADYNRFWKASISREYFLDQLNPFLNIFQVGGDRHYHAIDSATHSDEPYPSMDTGPCQYGQTYVTGSWMIDREATGTVGWGEWLSEASAYGTCEEDTSNCYAGGFGMVSLNAVDREITFYIKDHTGTTYSSSCADNLMQNLSYTFPISFTFIDEDFEGDGMEEDWTEVTSFLYKLRPLDKFYFLSIQ